MPDCGTQFDLLRCPHCSVDHPRMDLIFTYPSSAYDDRHKRFWYIYICHRCGGLVTAATIVEGSGASEIYPQTDSVDNSIPDPARSYLQQALDTIHAPSGSIMLSASAVDAMLKIKSYTEGNLHSRINKAAEDHLITNEMARWAHEIRLDANVQRHADQSEELPDTDDARKAAEFASALAEFLFVLPSRIQRGIASTSGDNVA